MLYKQEKRGVVKFLVVVIIIIIVGISWLCKDSKYFNGSDMFADNQKVVYDESKLEEITSEEIVIASNAYKTIEFGIFWQSVVQVEVNSDTDFGVFVLHKDQLKPFEAAYKEFIALKDSDEEPRLKFEINVYLTTDYCDEEFKKMALLRGYDDWYVMIMNYDFDEDQEETTFYVDIGGYEARE